MRIHVHALAVAATAALVGGCSGSSSGSSGLSGSSGSPPAPTSPTSSSSAEAVQHPKSLVGEVGEDDKFVIELKDDQGNDIENLAAGTYTLKVDDYSSIHNFHLSGGKVDDATDVGGKGVKTFSVTFTPGTYTFVCDPHASSMHGEFRVT